jgi:hypothetical protein
VRQPTQGEEKPQFTLRTRRDGGVYPDMNDEDLFSQFFGKGLVSIRVNGNDPIEIATSLYHAMLMLPYHESFCSRRGHRQVQQDWHHQ